MNIRGHVIQGVQVALNCCTLEDPRDFRVSGVGLYTIKVLGILGIGV